MKKGWFRYYREAVYDPKIRMLEDKTHRFWIDCLCLVDEETGELPPLKEIAIVTKKHLKSCEKVAEKLTKIGIFSHKFCSKNPEKVVGYFVTAWTKRQYKSDSSTERTRKHKAQKKQEGNVPETPPEYRIQNTDNKPPKSPLVRGSESEDIFDRFWKAYPRKTGKAPARKKWDAACKQVDPEKIILAARAYAAERQGDCARNPANERFTQEAKTWLNQQRWEDFDGAGAAETYTSDDWRAACRWWKKHGEWSDDLGGEPGSDDCRVPPEILEEFGLGKHPQLRLVANA